MKNKCRAGAKTSSVIEAVLIDDIQGEEKMKRMIITLLSLTLVFVFAGSLLATDKGNSRKGKYTFRKSCRDCHVEGGKAQEMSPSNKTQAQWDAVFAKDKFKGFPCKAEWEKLTAEDLNDIYAYMYEHAFDSPSPAKCK